MLKTPLVAFGALATLAVALSLPSRGGTAPTPSATPPTPTDGARLLRALPVAFVPNVGQWTHAARYVARFGAMTMFLEEKGWAFTLVEQMAEEKEACARGVAVRMTFVGAGEPTLVAENPLPGRHHYFLGQDKARWQSDVPLYGSVRYREVQPGVDVRAREHAGHFEYDLLLQPGASLEFVEFAVEGIERMHLDGDALVLETCLGPVRMPPPLSWEEGPSGEKSPITCRYALRADDRTRGIWCFGFEVVGRRPDWVLVVDPGLVWSTFLGGSSMEAANAIAVDPSGAATVAGDTRSPGFPVTPGAFDTTYNGGVGVDGDAFVTQLSPDGSSLVYSTFLGGSGQDRAVDLALDIQGEATVAGMTESANFPTTFGAFDTSHNGGADVFVARLSSTGSRLNYSTFLGGIGYDEARAVALDSGGGATVAAITNSTGFPTTPGAFDTTHNGGMDAIVARLAPTGSSLAYSTFLGGSLDDHAWAVALDSQGAATVAGASVSLNFPTTPGAFDTSHNWGSPQDAFVTRIAPTGSGLVYSTYLGGMHEDFAIAVAVDAQGAATVAGGTMSVDFPMTPNAFDMTQNGNTDAFVTRLAPTGSSLVYSTFIGGMGDDWVAALALDRRGVATVVGGTASSDFPTTPGAFDTSYNVNDAFVTQLAPTGSSLVHSTFLGGMGSDEARALALDAQGAAVLAGGAEAFGFPTTPGAFDTTHNGFRDAFVARLDMLPTGVSPFGRSSAGCAGALAISVTSMPQVGNAAFALTCSNAPPNTSGLLALTNGGFANPVVVLGTEIWVDPTRVLIQLPATSNTVGASDVPLPIPLGPWLRGTRLFAQFFWASPTSPPPCPPQGLSASHALEFTIQP